MKIIPFVDSGWMHNINNNSTEPSSPIQL